MPQQAKVLICSAIALSVTLTLHLVLVDYQLSETSTSAFHCFLAWHETLDALQHMQLCTIMPSTNNERICSIGMELNLLKGLVLEFISWVQ